jgi:hypothetical protein
MTLGVFLGGVGVSLSACTKVEDDNGSGNSKAGSGNDASGSGESGGANAGTTRRSSVSGGGKTSSGTGASVGGSDTPSTSIGAGNAPACQGIPTTKDAIGSSEAACNGVGMESEPFPADMVILMDRSISNGYAVGTDSSVSAAPSGTLRRWDVLTAGMRDLAGASNADKIGASITFFTLNGGADAETNCDASKYETPVVPMGMLTTTGPEIVAAMEKLTPSGLTPTEPALQGALQYAMALKRADPTREKVVVLVSDGFPTLCTNKAPSDVAKVIEEAANAPIPVKTYVVGIGSPSKISSGKFNLQNYARSGKTGQPILIDETASAEGISDQLVTALLNIGSSQLACEYAVKPPSDTQNIDPEMFTVTYEPAAGQFQEIPRVSGLAACSKSTQGGWYFDNAATPTKVTMCPCTCSNFGAGMVNMVYGCKPKLVIQ